MSKNVGFAAFIKKNVVTVAAMAAAAVSAVFVPPDAEYLGYFDFKTLACLFCTLAVVCALRDISFFAILAQRIVRRFRNARMCVLALVWITFLGSMLIANDMALLTFLPLGFFVLSVTGKQKYMAYTFILQNIAANLGGMLTPFGNPQNLYLYTKFNIPTGEFMSIMAIPFAVSVALVSLACLAVKPEPMAVEGTVMALDKKKTALYLALFALSITVVFRVIPYWVGVAVIAPALMIFDRKALRDVDYMLLLTFAAFFVFAGNCSRIPAVRQLLSGILDKNTLLVSTASCQVISNVPSAILLSRFTENYRSLLVGVNIGGVGTLISSLASLITFREYTKRFPNSAGKYLRLFAALNAFFLAALLALCMALGY